MVNYQDSQIYEITPVGNEKIGFPAYIGITVKKYLPMRYSQHKQQYKVWLEGKGADNPLYDIFTLFGHQNCQIKLIEEFPCETIYELTARQHYWISKKYSINNMKTGSALFEFLRKEEPAIIKEEQIEVIPQEAPTTLLPLIALN